MKLTPGDCIGGIEQAPYRRQDQQGLVQGVLQALRPVMGDPLEIGPQPYFLVILAEAISHERKQDPEQRGDQRSAQGCQANEVRAAHHPSAAGSGRVPFELMHPETKQPEAEEIGGHAAGDQGGEMQYALTKSIADPDGLFTHAQPERYPHNGDGSE